MILDGAQLGRAFGAHAGAVKVMSARLDQVTYCGFTPEAIDVEDAMPGVLVFQDQTELDE